MAEQNNNWRDKGSNHQPKNQSYRPPNRRQPNQQKPNTQLNNNRRNRRAPDTRHAKPTTNNFNLANEMFPTLATKTSYPKTHSNPTNYKPMTDEDNWTTVLKKKAHPAPQATPDPANPPPESTTRQVRDWHRPPSNLRDPKLVAHSTTHPTQRPRHPHISMITTEEKRQYWDQIYVDPDEDPDEDVLTDEEIDD